MRTARRHYVQRLYVTSTGQRMLAGTVMIAIIGFVKNAWKA